MDQKENFGSCKTSGYDCNGGVSGSCGDVVGSAGSCCVSACKTDGQNFMEDTLLNDQMWKQQVYDNSVNNLENAFTKQIPTMLANFATNNILRQKNSRKQIMSSIQGSTATAMGYDPERINSAELGVPLRMMKNGEYAQCSKYYIPAPNKKVRFYDYIPYNKNDLTLNIMTKTNGRMTSLFSNETLTSTNGLFKAGIDPLLGSINIYDNNGALAWDSTLYLDSFPTIQFTDAKKGTTTVPNVTLFTDNTKISVDAKKKVQGVYALRYLGIGFTSYTGPIIKIRVGTVSEDFYDNGGGVLKTSSGLTLSDFYNNNNNTKSTFTVFTTTGSLSSGSSSGGGSGGVIGNKFPTITSKTAYVSTWYDQSGGNLHATQIDTTKQPSISIGDLSLVSEIFFSEGTYFNLPDGSIPYGSSPYTVMIKHGDVSNTNGGFIGSGTYDSNYSTLNIDKKDTNYASIWWNGDYYYPSFTTGGLITETYDSTKNIRKMYLNSTEIKPNAIYGPNGINTLPATQQRNSTISNNTIGMSYATKGTPQYLNGTMSAVLFFYTSLKNVDRIVIESMLIDSPTNIVTIQPEVNTSANKFIYTPYNIELQSNGDLNFNGLFSEIQTFPVTTKKPDVVLNKSVYTYYRLKNTFTAVSIGPYRMLLRDDRKFVILDGNNLLLYESISDPRGTLRPINDTVYTKWVVNSSDKLKVVDCREGYVSNKEVKTGPSIVLTSYKNGDLLQDDITKEYYRVYLRRSDGIPSIGKLPTKEILISWYGNTSETVKKVVDTTGLNKKEDYELLQPLGSITKSIIVYVENDRNQLYTYNPTKKSLTKATLKKAPTSTSLIPVSFIQIYPKCNYILTETDANCYINNYVDLQNAYKKQPAGTSILSFAQTHWTKYGCYENRVYSCPVSTPTSTTTTSSSTTPTSTTSTTTTPTSSTTTVSKFTTNLDDPINVIIIIIILFTLLFLKIIFREE